MRRHCLMMLILPFFLIVGCAPGAWTRQEIGPGGAWVSMHLQIDGSAKELALVYADDQRVRAFRRTGFLGSWSGSFDSDSLRNAQFPAAAIDPYGDVWVAYLWDPPGASASELRVAKFRGDDLGFGSPDTLATGIALDEPPTILYQSEGVPAHKVIVVASVGPNNDLQTWTRTIGEDQWVAEGSINGMVGTLDPEGRGLQPQLFMEASIPRLIYGQGADGSPLIVRHNLYGTPVLVDDSADAESRFEVSLVEPPTAPHAGKIAFAYASCEGLPIHRVANDEVGFPNWELEHGPSLPTEVRPYCDPSVVHDSAGFVYLVSVDVQAGAPVVDIYNPVTEAWKKEFIANASSNEIEYTATAYDPLASELLVAYHNRTTNRLFLATRPAN